MCSILNPAPAAKSDSAGVLRLKNGKYKISADQRNSTTNLIYKQDETHITFYLLAVHALNSGKVNADEEI